MKDQNKAVAEDALDMAAAMRGMRSSLIEGGFSPEIAEQAAIVFCGHTMQILLARTQASPSLGDAVAAAMEAWEERA